MQTVTRHRDGRICALYVDGHIGLDAFTEEADEYAQQNHLRLQPWRYSAYWDIWITIIRPHKVQIQSNPRGYPVTAIDLLAWKK